MRPLSRRYTRKAATVAALCLLLAVSACSASSGGGQSSPESGGTKVGDTLTIANSQTMTNVNPGMGNGGGVFNGTYWNLAYQPLINMSADGKPEPSLATSWKFLDDTNTVFQLNLRSDAKFSDGNPVTSESVANYFEYNLKNANYAKYYLGGATFDTSDPHRLVIHLPKDKPRPDLPYALSDAYTVLGYIIGPDGLKNPDKLKLSTDGAGPYMLDTNATIPNSSWVYVRNPHYYNQSAVHWKKIVIKPMPSESARLAALKTGQVQVAVGSPRQVKSATEAGLQVVQGPLGAYAVVFGDLEGKLIPPLANLKVRQAMAYAVDWNAIAQGVFDGHALVTEQLVTKNIKGYDASLTNRYPYDPEKAKQLLAEAGYPHGFDAGKMPVGPPVGMPEVGSAIAAAWAKIGIKVQVLTLDPHSWLTEILNNVQPVNLIEGPVLPMSAIVPDLFDSANTRTKNSDYSDLFTLVDKAQHVPAGTSESTTAWQAVNQAISDTLPAVTGVMPDFVWLAKKDIGGITYNPPGAITVLRWYQK